jgi:signal transduction histidine kinase
MKEFSLKRRLIVAFAVSQILLAAGLILVGTSFSRHYLRRAFDVYLEGRAQSIAATVYYADDGSSRLEFNEAKVPPPSQYGHTEVFVVRSDHGDFERHTAGFDPHVFDVIPAAANSWNLEMRDHRFRAIVLRDVAIQDTEENIPQPLPRLTVVYAADTGGIEHQITRLGLIIGALSLVIFIPVMLFAFWSIRKALTPLDDLALAAGSISVASWKFEPSQAARSTKELQPLIGAITTVLAGLESAFARQREFVSDGAHELKTSLAILKSTLQTRLNRARQANEEHSSLKIMNEDCERLERLLNRMLQTARAEERLADGRERRRDPVDLVSSCEEAIAQLTRVAAEREIRIEFRTTGQAMVCAELADLELIWLNLLENAIQYSPRGSVVEMTVVVDPSTATITVADQGCGIDPAHLPQIFDRFYRADSSRARTTGGFGLGLSIAKSLVMFYGGQIRAESTPTIGSRFIVCLRLSEDLVAGQVAPGGPVVVSR